MFILELLFCKVESILLHNLIFIRQSLLTIHHYQTTQVVIFYIYQFTGMQAERGAKVMAIVIFFICGTISTFAFKLMSSQYVQEGDQHRKFFHPYMQAFTMFFGQALCIFIYASNLRRNKLPLQAGKQPHHFYYFFIPALADSCSSILQYMGLNFIAGSTYLMFKGASIVTTAIFSKLLFGMIIERRHWLGCGLAIGGLVIVGSSGLLLPSDDDSTSNQFLGYILMLISLVFNGFLYAYEQFLMRKHTINPLQMVGCQGCFGMFIIAFIALALSITPCNLKQSLCVYDSYGNSYFERVDSFFGEVFSDYILALLTVVGFVTISAYNLNGVRITKLIDALTRSLLNVTKTGIIWVVGIVISIAVGDNPDYQLQSKDLVVNAVKGAGFALIVMGTLVYNKIIFQKWLEADRQSILTPDQNILSLVDQQDENQDEKVKTAIK